MYQTVMPNARPMMFRTTCDEDGQLLSVTVEEWQPEVWVSERGMDMWKPDIIHRSGDVVTITAANGNAHYRVVEREELFSGFVFRMVLIGQPHDHCDADCPGL